MNHKFDELAKGLAQSGTRRQALKRFSVGLAGMALACFGLAEKAEANSGGCKNYGGRCQSSADCCSGICLFNGTCGCRSNADCKKGTSCNTGVCLGVLP